MPAEGESMDQAGQMVIYEDEEDWFYLAVEFGPHPAAKSLPGDVRALQIIGGIRIHRHDDALWEIRERGQYYGRAVGGQGPLIPVTIEDVVRLMAIARSQAHMRQLPDPDAERRGVQ